MPAAVAVLARRLAQDDVDRAGHALVVDIGGGAADDLQALDQMGGDLVNGEIAAGRRLAVDEDLRVLLGQAADARIVVLARRAGKADAGHAAYHLAHAGVAEGLDLVAANDDLGRRQAHALLQRIVLQPAMGGDQGQLRRQGRGDGRSDRSDLNGRGGRSGRRRGGAWHSGLQHPASRRLQQAQAAAGKQATETLIDAELALQCRRLAALSQRRVDDDGNAALQRETAQRIEQGAGRLLDLQRRRGIGLGLGGGGRQRAQHSGAAQHEPAGAGEAVQRSGLAAGTGGARSHIAFPNGKGAAQALPGPSTRTGSGYCGARLAARLLRLQGL